MITNSGTIAIDFLSPTPAFGFDFDRPTNTQTEVTLNVFAEDDVTLLSTETITLFFDGFIGFYAVFGFTACAVLILLAKVIGKVLKVKENYYDSESYHK